MKKSNVVLVLVCAIWSITAAAAPGDRVIKHLDQDGDGKVSLGEFQPPENSRMEKRGEMMLERMDTNGDGAVSRTEIEEMRQIRAQQMEEKMAEHASQMDAVFTEMDGDNDGMVSQDEMRKHRFSGMDQNGDGFLTGDELKRPKGKHHVGPRPMAHDQHHDETDD